MPRRRSEPVLKLQRHLRAGGWAAAANQAPRILATPHGHGLADVPGGQVFFSGGADAPRVEWVADPANRLIATADGLVLRREELRPARKAPRQRREQVGVRLPVAVFDWLRERADRAGHGEVSRAAAHILERAYHAAQGEP